MLDEHNHFVRRRPKGSRAGGTLDFRATALAGLANMTQISERLLVQAHLDAKQPKALSAEEEASLRVAIAAAMLAMIAGILGGISFLLYGIFKINTSWFRRR